MVRHKARPVRSLSPEETLNVLKQEEEDRTRAKEANGSASLSLWALEWVAGGGGDNGGGGPGAGPPSRKLPGFTPATSPSGALAAMPLSMMASLAKSKSSKLVIDEEEEEEDVPIEPEEDESEEEDEEYCHPLSNVQGMPSFSDLQVTIAKAIVRKSGRKDGSASVESILDYVSKKWKNLRRKDGSQYSSASTYIRRAVQANLRSTANGVALFKMDPYREGYWSVCQTVEEAKATFSGPLRPIQPRLAILPVFREILQQAKNQAEEEFWANYKDEPLSPSGSTSTPVMELTKEELQFYEAAKSRMTALQRTVSECIVQAGGSCHFEFILDTVQKQKWAGIKSQDELPRSTNVKKLVGACVARDRGEDSKALFMRDHNAESSGYWKLGLSNPYAKTSGLALADKDSVEGTSSSDHNANRRSNPPLTHLQELIVEAIEVNGEAADVETIYNFIKERWHGLVRRDGTPYTADIRRAVQSSLTSNSSQSPLFVKLSETDQTMWGLAARAKAYLRERRRRRRMDHHHHQPQQHRPTTDEGESDDMDEDHRLSSYEYGRDHSDGGSNSSSSNGQNGSNASRQADKPKKRRRKKNHFSGIQQMIAEVMDRNGGAAPFDLILTECQKRWRTLRKRDGSPYNADPKRSINASLTKTPAYGQVFERDPHLDGHWRLTPASQRIWDQLKKNESDPTGPRPSSTLRTLIPPAGPTMSPVGLVEASEAQSEEEDTTEPIKNEGECQPSPAGFGTTVGTTTASINETGTATGGELGGDATQETISSGSVLPAPGLSPPFLVCYPHIIMRGDDGNGSCMADDEAIEVIPKSKKRIRYEEPDEPPLEEDELEYGEGTTAEAPKLGTMQAMVIRTIFKNGGTCEFQTILDSLYEKVEKDKTLMAAVNWVRVHRSNFPTGNEEEDRHNVKIFSRDERGNWSVPDAKLSSWVMKHKKKRMRVDKLLKRKRPDE